MVIIWLFLLSLEFGLNDKYEFGDLLYLKSITTTNGTNAKSQLIVNFGDNKPMQHQINEHQILLIHHKNSHHLLFLHGMCYIYWMNENIN